MAAGSARKRPIRGWLLLAAIAMLSTVGMLVGPSAASANLQQEFAAFNDCPVSNPAVADCILSTTTSGEFKIGSKTVPITSPVILQGGITNIDNKLVPAADGNTLSKTPLELPGGLIGIELLPPLTSVTVTAELAGTVELNPNNLPKEKGIAAIFPLKAKVDNPALGSSCYIGSDAEPIVPQLTTGTTNPPPPNSPIKGKAGTPETLGFGKIIRVSGTSLVDNAFSAPGANGCAGLLSLVVDPSFDLVAGLPAASGHNTAILNGSLAITTPNAVVEQAALPAIGRCVKVEGVKEGKITNYHGHYVDSGCVETTPFVEGKFEWSPGPGVGKKFTTLAGTTTLETVGKSKLVCSTSSGQGEYTGAKTATADLTFSGCKLLPSNEVCQSAGHTAGEIVASGLQAHLGFVKDDVINGGTELLLSVGWDLTRTPSLFSAECGSGKAPLTVGGSVIAPLGTLDRMAPSNTLKFTETAGKQAPEAFEGAAVDTPSASFPSKPTEQAGLRSSQKVTNEEKLEVKAKAEQLE